MTKHIFSDADMDHIVKLHTVDGISAKKIGEIIGVGRKPIVRILELKNIKIIDPHIVEFDEATAQKIFNAYDSGIGAAGISKALSLQCSPTPVISLLRKKYGSIRGRSEQQQARMNACSPAEKARLLKNAHASNRGRKATIKEREKRAKTFGGKFHFASKIEPIVFEKLRKFFPDAIPSKAVGIYNIDISISDTVAVEVFGGGWSVSDKRRIDHYVNRTKKIGKTGIHTIFIIVEKLAWIDNIDNLVSTINFACGLPPMDGQYWVIWGNRNGRTGSSLDINHDSFIRPFVNIRDRRTGHYVSVPR